MIVIIKGRIVDFMKIAACSLPIALYMESRWSSATGVGEIIGECIVRLRGIVSVNIAINNTSIAFIRLVVGPWCGSWISNADFAGTGYCFRR